MKKQQKCYIYTRVSTSMQVEGYSLDAQKDKLRKYAEYQEMSIVGEYSDEGHSFQRKNFNLTKFDNVTQPKRTPEKEEAIRQAFKHLEII